MAYQLYIEYEGVVCHVAVRGDDMQNISGEDCDSANHLLLYVGAGPTKR